MTDDFALKDEEKQNISVVRTPFGNFPMTKDTSRKGIEEHEKETKESLQQAFGKEDESSEKNGGYFGAEDYKKSIEEQVKKNSEEENSEMKAPINSSVNGETANWQEKAQKDFDRESREIAEERIKAGMQASFDEDTERLKTRDALAERFESVKSFDELLVLLNDPEFPGIQGSQKYYFGEELRKILIDAKASGRLDSITRSHGLRDVVERLFSQEGRAPKEKDVADDVVDSSPLKEKKEENQSAKEGDNVARDVGVAQDHVEKTPDEEVSDALPPKVDLSKSEEKEPTAQKVDGNSEKENKDEEKEKPEKEDSGNEESLESLRNKVFLLKLKADAARNDFFSIKYREESGWKKVKSYFPFLKESKEASVVSDVEVLKGFWNVKLTEYKNARLELAKREVMESGNNKEHLDEILSNTLRELELQSSIETYNSWKDSEWSDTKDSWYLRAVGRAKDWGESYRKLDWKKRMAVSAMLVGIGAAGVVTGSVGLVGLGATGSAFVRLLGSYGVGRGVYEYLEARANKNLLQHDEVEIEHVAEESKKEGTIESLESRLSGYADRIQNEFDRRARGNRNRIIVGTAIGTVLFVGGTAMSCASALQNAEKIADGGKAAEAIREMIASQGSDTSAHVTEVLPVSEQVIPETSQLFDVAPTSGASGLVRHVSEYGEITSGAKDATIGQSGQALEIVKEAGKALGEMAVVPKGSSVEAEIIKYLMEQPNIISKEEAGAIAHRMVVGYVNTHADISLDDVSLVQPGTKLSIFLNPGSERMPFKLGSIEFAPPSGENVVIADHIQTVPVPEVSQPVPVPVSPPEPVEISPPPAPHEVIPVLDNTPPPKVSVPNVPAVNLDGPPDIFDTPLPSERVIASHGPILDGEMESLGAGAGFAAGGMAWDRFRKKRKKKDKDSQKNLKEKNEKEIVPVALSHESSLSSDVSEKDLVSKGENKMKMIDHETIDSDNPPDILERDFSTRGASKENSREESSPPVSAESLTHGSDAKDSDMSSVLNNDTSQKKDEDLKEKEKPEVSEPILATVSPTVHTEIPPEPVSHGTAPISDDVTLSKISVPNTSLDFDNPPDILDKDFSAPIVSRKDSRKESSPSASSVPVKLLTHSPDAKNPDIASVSNNDAPQFPWEKWKNPTLLLGEDSHEKDSSLESVSSKDTKGDSSELIPDSRFEVRELLTNDSKDRKLLTHEPVIKDSEISESLSKKKIVKEGSGNASKRDVVIKTEENLQKNEKLSKNLKPKGASPTSRQRRKPKNLNEVILPLKPVSKRGKETTVVSKNLLREEIVGKERMKKNEEDILRNSEKEKERKLEIRRIFSELASLLVPFPIKKEAFEGIGKEYAVFSDRVERDPEFRKTREYTDKFNNTRESIATIFFGSNNILLNSEVLEESFSVAVAFDKERSEDEYVGLFESYAAFQQLFRYTGGSLPREILSLSIEKVFDIFTERFLTGKIPEELNDLES